MGAVLCGLDMHITFTKMSKAFQYLTRNPGCQFLATNTDSTYPVAGGLLPGAGSISAPLRFALEKDPISIGKPAATMLDCIKAKYVSTRIVKMIECVDRSQSELRSCKNNHGR